MKKKNIVLRSDAEQEQRKIEEQAAANFEYKLIAEKNGLKVIQTAATKYALFHWSGYGVGSRSMPKGRALELMEQLLKMADFTQNKEAYSEWSALDLGKKITDIVRKFEEDYGTGKVPEVHKLFEAREHVAHDETRCAYCGTAGQLHTCRGCGRNVCFSPACRAPDSPDTKDENPRCVTCVGQPSYASQDPSHSNGACPICKQGLANVGFLEMRPLYTEPGNGPQLAGAEYRCPAGHSVVVFDMGTTETLDWVKKEMAENRMQRQITLEKYIADHIGDAFPSTKPEE